MLGRVPDPQAVLRGHRGEVQALDFDADERYLVSGDSLGEVRVWNLEDMRPSTIRQLHPPTAGVLHLCLFASGTQQLLCTQGRDGTTLLWEIHLGVKAQLSDNPFRRFVRDCYSFCRASVLAADGAACSQAAGATGSIAACSQAAAAAAAGAADTAAEQRISVQHMGPAEADTPRSGAAALSSTSHCNTPLPAGPTCPETSHTAAAIWALHPCPHASAQHPPALLAIPGSSERTAEVLCCSCGTQLAEFLEAAAGRKLGMLMAVQLYCPPPPPDAPPLAGHASICLAAGYEDGSVVVWDVGAAAVTPMHRKLCKEPIMSLRIDATGGGGVCGSAEQQIACFKIQYGAHKLSLRYIIELQRKGIGDITLRRDGKLLATAGWDHKVRVYKYRDGDALAILKYHTSPVTSVQFAPRSMRLATAARDGTVALWSL